MPGPQRSTAVDSGPAGLAGNPAGSRADSRVAVQAGRPTRRRRSKPPISPVNPYGINITAAY